LLSECHTPDFTQNTSSPVAQATRLLRCSKREILSQFTFFWQGILPCHLHYFYVFSSVHSAASSTTPVIKAWRVWVFSWVTTGPPVSCSSSLRAFPAMRPPRWATLRFSSSPWGFSSREILVVDASANILSTSSKSFMLS